MAYSQLLSSQDPGCILILIDQSSSMDDPYGGAAGGKKKTECARAVNRVLREIVLCCSPGERVKDRCYIGVIGYGPSVASAFLGPLTRRDLVKVSEVANGAIRVDKVKQKVSDGAGGLVEVENPFPIWIEEVADDGTPMDEAFVLAARWVSDWISQHANSFPPIVINITDGEPNKPDDTRATAQTLMKLQTNDGNLILINAHISDKTSGEVALPEQDNNLPDEFARLLFDISSILPDRMLQEAKAVGFNPGPKARGFVYNANAETLIKLLAFGSNPGLR
ncbi:MAG: VWA domain-containing protein [Acidobacteriota bacterium]